MLTPDQVLGKGRYRIIGNYTLDDTNSLYEAYDTVSNTNVVLRETVGTAGGVMTPTQLDQINSAFAGEAKTLSEARHESLLSVQDYFSEIDRHYLVMESVDGTDLTKLLQPDEKAPAFADLMKWADQVLAALDYLHSLPSPVIHKDIRPATIQLTSNFKVKVLTAGLGNNEWVSASSENLADAAILNYRPLEQLWSGLDSASQKVISNSYDDRSRRILTQPLDARSDIYAVGATFYHLLTRTMPKDALERSIEILDGNSDPLQTPAEIDGSIPEEVSEVIMKAMELRREHRYDSAAIMRQVLTLANVGAKTRIQSQPKNVPAPEPLPDAHAEKPVPLAANAETIEEQRRAELRRLELEAETERQRQQAEHVKAAQELVRSKTQHVEPAQPTTETLLLEVEPVKSVADEFEWAADISEQPVSQSTASSKYSDDIEFNIQTPTNSNMKFIVAGAGGLIVLVAILGWLFMGSAPVKAPQAAQVPVQQNVQQEQPPVSAFSEANSAPQITEQEPQISEPVTAENPNNNQSTPKKKSTPSPAKAAQKKKVTVDDLINDN